MESWAACLSGRNDYKKTQKNPMPDTFPGVELIYIVLNLNAAKESNIL